MIRVVHLVDDARVGGVQTALAQLLSKQSGLPGAHTVCLVNSAKPHEALSIKADFVVVHFSVAWRKLPFLMSLRAKNARSQLILQDHHYCAEHFQSANSALSRFAKLLRVTALLFDQVFAVSAAQAAWLRELGGRVDGVIAPMADLTELLALPVRPQSRNPVVGVSGRLCRAKGFDLFLEMLSLPNAERFDFLIGGYGEMAEDMCLAARRHHNVRFLGRYKNPVEFLQRCDLVLIPSRQETFGLNCLEAKAAAKPVVVTRCGGLSEQASSSGVVVEGFSASKLLQGLQELQSLPGISLLCEQARTEASAHNQKVIDLWSKALNMENEK